jgi:tetratricopeptide (TPR) repeat protein
MACFALAFSQHQYTSFVITGNRAVAEKRFDTQAYDYASRVWFANQDMLLFNQGVLAYKAQNFSQAADHFRRVSQRTHNPSLRMQALYNLGLVMLALDEVESAAELFKEALRVDPLDPEAKFNLERLYQWVLLKENQHGEASLEQAPGLGKDKGEGLSGEGAGRSTPKSDI